MPQAIVEVWNHGPPIPREELPRIFEPFSDTARTDRSRLGLYIVDAIVSAHGGRIEVSSSRAEGTTFVVYLPKRPAESTRSPPPHAPSPA